MKVSSAVILALAASYSGVVSAQEVPPFDNCGVDAYYADLFAEKGAVENWTFDDVAELVTSTQRYQLNSSSTVSGGDDIFAALTDLDQGVVNIDDVLLLYRNLEVPKIPAGTQQSWTAERLFPILRGATRESGAANDVFNMKPADTSVLLVKKGRFFFGECGTVESQDMCVSPATLETSFDTAADGKIITPPVASRGDVARSLFYMAVRYESIGLFLSDCPPFAAGEFGYLTPLLEWDIADPVTAPETARNDRACERWQGNRNPFIDYPQLVEQFFGTPDVIRSGTKSYTQCLDETDAPTATPNECSSLKGGDAMVFLVNSDEPDQVIFFPLVEIPATVGSLYLTDNAYLGDDKLATNEGTIEVRNIYTCCWYCTLSLYILYILLTFLISRIFLLLLSRFFSSSTPQFNIPEGGIAAGKIFGYGDGSPFSEQWENPEGLFDLSVAGDQFFLYCLDADDLPHFITGFSYNGAWMEAEDIRALEEVPLDKSALPEDLFELGAVFLPHGDNHIYTGEVAGSTAELLLQFMDPLNYEASNALRYGLVDQDGSGARSLFSALVTLVAMIPLVAVLLL
jgi:endonuclease I